MLTRRDNCRLCHSRMLDLVLSLGSSALANQFVSDPDIKQNEFPLDLFQCKGCDHFQLLDIVDPEIMFSNYLYVSGTSRKMQYHFRNYACSIVSEKNLDENDLVVDIGSNDSTLLKWFDKLEVKTVGVEPAVNLARKSNEDGIKTYNDFFNKDLAQKIINNHGKASVITCNNVFAHADNLDEIVLGVKKLLKDNGVFIFEVSYFNDVMKTNDFSQIYSEHVSFHTISPLFHFFKRHDMKLFDVKKIDIHGGSIRCYVRKYSSSRFSDLYEPLLMIERGTEKSLLNSFVNNTQNIKTKLKNKLLEYKRQGKKISGVLAAAKSTTFLHYCDIGPDILDYIYDDAREKVGLYSPGKKIKIKPFSDLPKDNPDYLLVLSYNFADIIVKNHPEFKGTWVVPLPEYKEINV